MNEFESLLTRDHLAARLGLTTAQMTWWIWALRESRRYHEFEIERRSGGAPRLIQTPIKPIRDMQETLLSMLTAAYEPWPHVHGFVEGRSAVTNASVHRGQRWILRIDLKDFFPSIHFGRVRGMFMAQPFDVPPNVATALAQICCHQGALPQGAPTSPVISNLICRGLDTRLARFASAAHCTYSRYADDLCFSTGRSEFPRVLAEIVDRRPILNPDLRAIVSDEGFTVNEDKTRLMPRFQRQRVTGLVVNKKLNIPREYYRHLRAVLYIWKRYGLHDAETAFHRARPLRNWPPEKSPPDFRLVVRGQLQYLGFVRNYDRIYQRLAQTLSHCDPTFTPSFPSTPQSGQVVFAGEGQSDGPHLFAALHALRADFLSLHLVEPSHNRPTNDDQLWNWLHAVKDSRNLHPRAGIFDADSKYAARIGPDGWRHLGNGVVAVTLAKPPWIAENAPFCIEMLHRPETLAREDDEGRRVFLRSEFDPGGESFDKRFQMRYPQKSTLVVEHVDRLADGKSVALSKTAFAEAVYGSRSPYTSLDFEGFRPTFERLWRAVAVAQTACG
jgi:RNA-directed DNA polymerase